MSAPAQKPAPGACVPSTLVIVQARLEPIKLKISPNTTLFIFTASKTLGE
jgi:hypothetical protein